MTRNDVPPEMQLGDAPVEDKYRDKMRELASMIDMFFNGRGPRVVGFCLMVFDLGEGPGRANYMSNAQRSDIIKLLKEQIAHFEKQDASPPA